MDEADNAMRDVLSFVSGVPRADLDWTAQRLMELLKPDMTRDELEAACKVFRAESAARMAGLKSNLN